jgi:succinyl-CoA synthetase beta subunit
MRIVKLAQAGDPKSMNIHEYQAKDLAEEIRRCRAGRYSRDELWPRRSRRPKKLKSKLCMSSKPRSMRAGAARANSRIIRKGKGGVRLCKTIDEVKAAAEAMLGQTLVTKQTGPEGKEVQRLYITDGVDISKEYYCSVRAGPFDHPKVTFMVSTEGGMDIEKVAHDSPEKIFKVAIDPDFRHERS